MNVSYGERIPNNVGLAGDKALQRALERWQPEFLGWWGEMGPGGGAQSYDVYTAQGWKIGPTTLRTRSGGCR